MYRILSILVLLLAASSLGCHGKGMGKGRYGANGRLGPEHDRPFPVGAATDAFWETQQTNAEAADFIFFDHEFEGNTAMLTPGAKKKLMSVALRLEHVPFPVVIEEGLHNRRPQLDVTRRRTIVEQLARLGVEDAEQRVVIAPAFAEGFSATEGESAYYQVLSGGLRGGGRGDGR
jgi:hypothetical protein